MATEDRRRITEECEADLKVIVSYYDAMRGLYYKGEEVESGEEKCSL